MRALHPDAELAPRDVVARAIFAQRKSRLVYLDTRRALGASVNTRFPTLAAACRKAGIDPATAPIPVAPAAHYHMGGIAVDQWGRTSLAGLWAAAKSARAACTEPIALQAIHCSKPRVCNARRNRHSKHRSTARARLKSNSDASPRHAGASELAAIASCAGKCTKMSASSATRPVGVRLCLHCIDEAALARTFARVAQSAGRRAARDNGGARAPGKPRQPLPSDFPASENAFAKRSFSTLQGAA